MGLTMVYNSSTNVLQVGRKNPPSPKATSLGRCSQEDLPKRGKAGHFRTRPSPLARKKTRYLSALPMSATMHSTAPQPEQPWQLPHPLRGLSLSPQWSWQSHRPRIAMRRTASTASTAMTSATTIVDGVQTKPIIGAPPFLRFDIGDAPESASPKVTLSRLYAASFSVSSLRATFSSFLS